MSSDGAWFYVTGYFNTKQQLLGHKKICILYAEFHFKMYNFVFGVPIRGNRCQITSCSTGETTNKTVHVKKLKFFDEVIL
jgi:hypothetical protein